MEKVNKIVCIALKSNSCSSRSNNNNNNNKTTSYVTLLFVQAPLLTSFLFLFLLDVSQYMDAAMFILG